MTEREQRLVAQPGVRTMSLPSASEAREASDRRARQLQLEAGDAEDRERLRREKLDDQMVPLLERNLTEEILEAIQRGAQSTEIWWSKIGISHSVLKRACARLSAAGYEWSYSEETREMGDSAAPCGEEFWVITVKWEK